MSIHQNRLVILGICGVCLLVGPGQLWAQWGTNAPPCSNGPCVPPRGSFGYYKTCWRPWPCAMQPESIQRTSSPIESIPPSNIELPHPSKEAEIRVQSPTRQPINRPLPGGTEPTLAPLPGDQAMPPAPLGDEATPGVPPSGRSDINSMPMTVPGTDLPPDPMPPSGSQGAAPQAPGTLPRLKLRTMGADNVAGREALPIQGPRLINDEREESTFSTAIKLRRMNDEPKRSSSVLGEPELLVPSTPVKPLERSSDATECKSTSTNPLRSGVVSAAIFEEGMSKVTNEHRSSSNSKPLQTNPLRR